MSARVARAALLALSCSIACGRAPEASHAAPAASEARLGEAPLPVPAASQGASSSAVNTASASSASAPSVPSAAPAAPDSAVFEPLIDENGGPLPQTDARPTTSSPAFQRRMQLLAEAIIENDPALAAPVFFPVVAYQQVKAIEKPERDWKARLWRAFERNVRDYHQKLGPDASAAKLHSVTVRESAVRFMKPGSEGNRVGYFRVTRNQLRFTLANGSERTFEITSLISWRGEWFVVHLDGFG